MSALCLFISKLSGERPIYFSCDASPSAMYPYLISRRYAYDGKKKNRRITEKISLRSSAIVRDLVRFNIHQIFGNETTALRESCVEQINSFNHNETRICVRLSKYTHVRFLPLHSLGRIRCRARENGENLFPSHCHDAKDLDASRRSSIINGSLKLYRRRRRVQVCKQARGKSCQKLGARAPHSDLILRPSAISLIFKTRNATLPLGEARP